MYRVSLQLRNMSGSLGETRNAVGTRATGECFHSFSEFSQTSTHVSTTGEKDREHEFLVENTATRKRKTTC